MALPRYDGVGVVASEVSDAGESMSFGYYYYGLGLSADKALWGAEDPLIPAEIFVRSQSWKHFNPTTTSETSQEWFRYEKLSNGTHLLHWDQIAVISISEKGRCIEYSLAAERWHSTFCHHLLPQALSFSLLEQGIDPLHGCVVEINGVAVAFIGESGKGKSTLAAYFWKKGHRILSDDLVAIRFQGKTPIVSGGPPHLKLSSRSLGALDLDPGKTQAFLEGTSKYILDMQTSSCRDSKFPLAMIYAITEEPSPTIEIQAQKLCQTFMALTRNPFNAIQNERIRWQTQFEAAAKIINTVPVRRLSFPRDFAALPKVYERLMKDVKPFLRVFYGDSTNS